MLRSTSILAFTAVLTSTAVARADEAGGTGDAPEPVRSSKWYAGAGSFARWFGDTSAASISEQQLFGPQVTVGRRLADLPGPRRGFTLSAVARFGAAFSEGTLFQTLETRIDQLSFTGGARLELGLWKWMSASAQLDVGAARTHVRIGETEMAPVDDSGWHVIGTAWTGVQFGGVVRGRFSVALIAELGYTVTQGVGLRATPGDHPEPELSIPTVYAALGDLDTRGLTSQMTFRLGF
jgi:hypothetical protein